MRILYLMTLLTLAASLAKAQDKSPAYGLPVPTPERLGGQERTLCFLSTDKPIYKPGETVYLRAVVLQAGTFFPAQQVAEKLRSPSVGLTITGPRQDKIARQSGGMENSTVGFAWKIPENTPGGRYLASVEHAGGAPAVRPFEIRVYAPPRLRSQIEFLRDGYGPGDAVAAVARITRAEGGIPTGARVVAVARVDGVEVARVPDLTVDDNGDCRAEFALPAAMERGEGTLAFVIEDGGLTETASKTIPILLQTLDLVFYPEGGDLTAGLSGRVYLQARRPDGKPADIRGEIVQTDADGIPTPGEALTSVETAHEGRGVFSFTPEAGQRYALRVLRPSGITRLFPLPPIRASGVVLRAEKNAYRFDEPVSLQVSVTPGAGASRITLLHREKLVAAAAIPADGGPVELDAGDAEGVLMATVWSTAGTPLAERLVFRKAKFAVKVAVEVATEPAGGSPTPGGKVTLNIVTTDENGRPMEAVVGLAVTDDALLEMVEKRDQQPSLPVMVYLENEVKDLADAHVYLDPDNPDADRDVDLLLGTQGWRRFVLARLDEALEKDPDAVRRALAIRKEPPPIVLRPVDGAVPLARAPRGEVMRLQAMRGDVEEMAMMVQPEFAEAEEKAFPDAPMEARVAAPAKKEVVAMRDEAGVQPNRGRAPRPFQEPRRPAPEHMAAYLFVREYAHNVRPNRRPNDRVDFTETLYWNAGLRTNPRDGTASVSFGLSDSVTTFRVRADAFANNGALGASTLEMASVEPFYVETKFPPVVVAGDRVDIPVLLVNATAGSLPKPGIVARCEGLNPVVGGVPGELGAGARERATVTLTAERAGEYQLVVNAAAGEYTDTVTRTLKVLRKGFPVQETHSGMVGPGKAAGWRLTIPDDVVAGSMRTSAKIFPTPLANMEEALNALLRQPHGCFEQTSSTSYPLVMAQQYFLGHTGVSPDKIKRAHALLEESYRKLTGFESRDRGYEWFGGDPGHEALTAYGLMQFVEMARVMPVDGDMIDRTRRWLMDQRDGEGGFRRNPKALDSFGRAPIPLTNLYILWTLLESGEKPESLAKEIAEAKRRVAETKDPYLLALGVNILYLAGDLPAARTAAGALRELQDKDGSLPGAETTITRSSGDSLLIETTSLAIIGWLRCGDDYAGVVESAMTWLFERCKAGRFGSTQSTILALKAINAYDAARAKPKAPGAVRLLVDGKPFGKPLPFDDQVKGALELPDFSAALTPGEHTIALEMDGGGDMPFALAVDCHTPRPVDSPDCRLVLETAFAVATVAEGEPLEVKVTVRAGDADVSMPLAIIGVPAGVEPRHERLKELVAGGQISAYEMIGRDLVLYWRAFKAGETVEVSIPLLAGVPGRYAGPASRVYAYYADEHKRWVAGGEITVTGR